MTQEEELIATAWDTLRHNQTTERLQYCADLLRDCTPIPKDELERYKRALWRTMLVAGYPGYHNLFDGYFVVFQEAELADSGGNWTDAAHAFAAEMERKP